jgi:hypothetical protein
MGTAASSSAKGRQSGLEIAMRNVVVGLLLGTILFVQTGCFEVVVEEPSDGWSYTTADWWYEPGDDYADSEEEWVEESYQIDEEGSYYDESYDWSYDEDWYEQWYYDEWYYDWWYDAWHYDTWYYGWYYWF